MSAPERRRTMEAYVKGGGTFPTRWCWFVAAPGITDADFDSLMLSDVEAYGFTLTRRGAHLRAQRRLARIDGQGPLEQVGRA